MTDEQRKAYAARISQSNRSELVVIIYELMLDSIAVAKEALEQQDFTTADKELKRTQSFLQELRGSLDFQYAISGNLLALYRYINEQLLHSILRRKNVNLDSCEQVIRGLKEGFEEVAKQDTSGPLMGNSQQVYAGLTYGKDHLNEFAMDFSDKKRGFTV